jgi:hypothetical protein
MTTSDILAVIRHSGAVAVRCMSQQAKSRAPHATRDRGRRDEAVFAPREPSQSCRGAAIDRRRIGSIRLETRIVDDGAWLAAA